MEDRNKSIETLREQEVDLCRQIAELEAAAEGSSSAGIREFRRTRLAHLRSVHLDLSQRLDRIDSDKATITETFTLSTALKNASLVADSMFGQS